MITKSFFIPITPVAKGRPRFSRRGKFVCTYTPRKTVDYESLLRMYLLPYRPGNLPMGPCRAEFIFWMPRPGNAKNLKWHIRKPDGDNLVKALMDTMNKSFFNDDSQLCDYRIQKRYCEPSNLIGIQVNIKMMESEKDLDFDV